MHLFLVILEGLLKGIISYHMFTFLSFLGFWTAKSILSPSSKQVVGEFNDGFVRKQQHIQGF